MPKVEISKKEHEFKDEFKNKQHCWTLVRDFDGEIESYFDDNAELHFIGIGNLCFFTAQ
jgi:hypothetical protein